MERSFRVCQKHEIFERARLFLDLKVFAGKNDGPRSSDQFGTFIQKNLSFYSVIFNFKSPFLLQLHFCYSYNVTIYFIDAKVSTLIVKTVRDDLIMIGSVEITTGDVILGHVPI